MKRLLFLSLFILSSQTLFCAAPAKARLRGPGGASLYDYVQEAQEKGVSPTLMTFETGKGERINALSAAIQGGDPDVVELVLEKLRSQGPEATEAYLRETDTNGNSSLMHTMIVGDNETAQRLLALKANVEGQNDAGSTAVDEAAVRGNVRGLELLAEVASRETLEKAEERASKARQGKAKKFLNQTLKAMPREPESPQEPESPAPAIASGKNAEKNKKKRLRKKAKQEQEKQAQEKQEKIYRKHEEGDYAFKPEEQEFMQELLQQMSLDPHGSSDEVKK